VREGRTLAAAVALAGLASCGARTGLEESRAAVDAAIAADAARPIDAAPCVPATPPLERCNARDDDCDGAVDEGLPYAPIAPAHTLRATEGDTGATELCSSCRWAWRPALAPTESGFLVPFHIGIYGGREEPALFARRTGADGVPLGEVEQLGMDVPLWLRRLDEADADGASWVDATWRVGSDDLAGWLVVARDGSVRALRAGLDRRAAQVTSVPVGDGVLAAWQRGGEALEASRFDRGGRALGVRTLAPGLLAGGGLAVHALAARADGEGAVLFVARFVAEPRRFSLHAIRIDADGDGEAPVTLLEDGATLQLRATRTEGGYLLFDPGNGTGASVRFVDAALVRIGEPSPIDPGVDGSDLTFDYVRAGDGFVVVSGDALVRLDLRGRPTASWRGRLAPGDDEGGAYVTTPDLAVREGRLFVAWHAIAEDRTPNPVWIRELGCVEPAP
jgi:hypothetical protein